MPDKQQTSMQELIDYLRMRKDGIKTDSAIDRFRKGAYTDAIVAATSLLPREREQIVKAHTEGQALIVGLCKEHFGGFDETMEEVRKARSGNDDDTKSIDYFTQHYSL